MICRYPAAVVAAGLLALALGCSQSGGEALEASRLPVQPIPPVPTDSPRVGNGPEPTASSQVSIASIEASRPEVQQPAPSDAARTPADGAESDEAGPAVEAPAKGAEIVTYKQGAFSPKKIEIEVGQTIRFVNGSDKDMWPASNIHPTHLILPELDAKRPIGSGGTWEHTFGEPGFWRYHNHMDPSAAGLVVVKGDKTPRFPT